MFKPLGRLCDMFEFPSLEDLFRHVPVSLDPPNFGLVRKPFLERREVVLLLAFLGQELFELFRSACFPQADVGIVRARQDVAIIHTKLDAEYSLHSPRVVHFSRMSAPRRKYAYGAVVGARHKLSACRRVVQGHHCRHMVFVDTGTGCEGKLGWG